MKTKKYHIFRQPVLHQATLQGNLHLKTATMDPNNKFIIFFAILLEIIVRNVSQQRSWHVGCGTLSNRAATTNEAMTILMT